MSVDLPPINAIVLSTSLFPGIIEGLELVMAYITNCPGRYRKPCGVPHHKVLSQCRWPSKIGNHCISRQNQWSLDDRPENKVCFEYGQR